MLWNKKHNNILYLYSLNLHHFGFILCFLDIICVAFVYFSPQPFISSDDLTQSKLMLNDACYSMSRAAWEFT